MKTIGNDCVIHWNRGTEIFDGAIIGDRCKIQAGALIFSGVTLEEDVFVGPGVVFTNDKYPRAYRNLKEFEKTLVKKGASIGANATIICGITIGEYAFVGAGSVVTKDVPDKAIVIGNPARIVGRVKDDDLPSLEETQYGYYVKKEG